MLLEKSAFLFYTKTLEEAKAEKERLLLENPDREITILIRTDRVHNQGETNE